MTGREKWADKDHKWLIIEERKFMWYEEQIDRLASAMDFNQGMQIVDVGCGLGYLGWTYWKHFGDGGTYIGVDCSYSLLEEAQDIAEDWSEEGTACFINGDCYNIPMENGSVDVAMCQTLLQHLEFPEQALREMIRITKPGGIIMCKDLDNISQFMKLSYSTVTDHESIDDILFYRKMRLVLAKGRKELGFGDLGIGSRVPRMMHEADLTEIEMFCNERLEFLVPPYKDPQQKLRLEIRGRYTKETTAEERQESKDECRDYYIAGGANPDSFDIDYNRLLEIAKVRREKRRKQIDDQNLFACSGGSNFFCIFGRKPY